MNHRPLAWVLGTCLFAACGGPPPAAEPTTEVIPAPHSEKGSAPEPAASEEAPVVDAAPAATAEPPPAPPTEKPSRPPTEMLVAAKVAYVIAWELSATAEAARKTCDAIQEVDQNRACLKQKRGEFVADVVMFKQDAAKNWKWGLYQRTGARLVEIFTSALTLKEETENSVTFTVADKGKGTQVLFAGSKTIKVTVPNDYSIVIEDPKFGRLVYDAKVGLVGGGEE